MGITVKELIKQLKKMPPDAEILRPMIGKIYNNSYIHIKGAEEQMFCRMPATSVIMKCDSDSGRCQNKRFKGVIIK